MFKITFLPFIWAKRLVIYLNLYLKRRRISIRELPVAAGRDTLQKNVSSTLLVAQIRYSLSIQLELPSI